MRALILAAAALSLAACTEAQPPAGAPAGAEPDDAPPEGLVTGRDARAGRVAALGGVPMNGDINGLGTEPFWAVEIRQDRITVTGLDRPRVSAPNPGPRIEGGMAFWEAQADNGGTLRIMLMPGECSDGMSDRTYPLDARVDVGGEVLVGCAATSEFILGTNERGEPRG